MMITMKKWTTPDSHGLQRLTISKESDPVLPAAVPKLIPEYRTILNAAILENGTKLVVTLHLEDSKRSNHLQRPNHQFNNPTTHLKVPTINNHNIANQHLHSISIATTDNILNLLIPLTQHASACIQMKNGEDNRWPVILTSNFNAILQLRSIYSTATLRRSNPYTLLHHLLRLTDFLPLPPSLESLRVHLMSPFHLFAHLPLRCNLHCTAPHGKERKSVPACTLNTVHPWSQLHLRRHHGTASALTTRLSALLP